MSQQNQYPEYPGQQQYYPQPKPKKHRFRNFVVIPFASIVAFIVVVAVAASNSGSNDPSGSEDPTVRPSSGATAPAAAAQPSKASKAPPPPASSNPDTDNTKCTGDRNDPCTVKLGVAFTVGKHRLDKGWKLRNEEFVGTKVVGQVTNVSDEPSAAFFHIKFLNGSKVVANFQCTTGELEPDQSEDIECWNFSDVSKRLKPGSYNRITAEADF